jgi:CheY-like chemotaxis protein
LTVWGGAEHVILIKKNMVFKILITDDDEDDYYILTNAFKNLKLEHCFEQLKGGEELINHLFKFKDDFKALPDLIILDYNMPKMNGLQTLVQIRAQTEFNKVPVIIHSTCNDKCLKQLLIANGATAYVPKKGSLKEIEEFVLALDAYLKGDGKILNQLSEISVSAYL